MENSLPVSPTTYQGGPASPNLPPPTPVGGAGGGVVAPDQGVPAAPAFGPAAPPHTPAPLPKPPSSEAVVPPAVPPLPAGSPPSPPPPPAGSPGRGISGPGGPAKARRVLTFAFILVVLVFVGYLGISLLRGVDFSKIPLISTLFPPARREVNLTYWGLWESPDLMKSVLDDFVTAYTAEHPRVSLTITYEMRSFGTLEQYKETLLTRLRQGTAPDIMRVHNSWISEFSEELAPLPSEVMSETDYSTTFYPVALNSARVGGQIYAIPLMYDGLILFYNKDLFEGVDVASELSTWEGFRREAVKRTQWEENDPRKKILQAGAAFGAAHNIAHASDLLSLLLVQSGVDPLTDLEKQESADALSFYTNFVRVDHVWDETLPYSINAFANGQVAMVFGPSWWALNIRDLNPQLRFAAVPVPQLSPAHVGGVHWATFWMEAVNKDSEDSDVAWALLKYLAEEGPQRKLYAEAAKTRYFGEPYSRTALASALADHELLGPLVKGAKYAVSGKTVDRSGNKPYVDAFKQAISAVLGGRSATDALKTAQATINQLEGKPSPSE